jgi:hypothetical protein
MPIIQIYADTQSPGTCRSCGERIEWAETIKGTRIPFNRPLVAIRMQGSIIEDGRAIAHVDTTVSPTHFETCPDAKDWRRRTPRR